MASRVINAQLAEVKNLCMAVSGRVFSSFT
jgi:hypothetical protein